MIICELYIYQTMVNLLQGSQVDQSQYPNSFKWDNLVRKHFSKYQDLIDAHTYRIQRIQRGWLSLPYPKYYNTELLTVQLLKRKQEVGEVEQNQIDLYKNIDPCISSHFNRTFGFPIVFPIVGLGVGSVFFAFSTYFNFSIPTRFVLSVVPAVIDWLRVTRDPKNEQRSLDFLNWVVGYRQAKCFAEIHHKQFSSEQVRKLLGTHNLLEAGTELLKLASK